MEIERPQESPGPLRGCNRCRCIQECTNPMNVPCRCGVDHDAMYVHEPMPGLQGLKDGKRSRFGAIGKGLRRRDDRKLETSFLLALLPYLHRNPSSWNRSTHMTRSSALAPQHQSRRMTVPRINRSKSISQGWAMCIRRLWRRFYYPNHYSPRQQSTSSRAIS
jgi:hypothetical protein